MLLLPALTARLPALTGACRSPAPAAAQEHGPVHIDVQRRIKAALDPDSILNPGKMYYVPPKL